MIADSNVIWAATNKGLFKIEHIDFKLKKYNVFRINTGDGLGSDATSGLVLRNDTIWVSSNKGVDYFNVSKCAAIKSPPIIYIYSISVNDSDVQIEPYYSFNYNYKSIRIGFAAIAFRGADETTFGYRLNTEDRKSVV